MIEPMILWGGTDVNPVLYGEMPHPRTQMPDLQRDADECKAVYQAIKEGIPVIGVCRGAQLLCVINGGTLYQHTIPTKQSHGIYVEDERGLVYIKRAAAGHHQIMRPSGNYELIGWNPDPVQVYTTATDHHEEKNTAEVVWFPDTQCLAIQPHPEWEVNTAQFLLWINEFIKSKGIDYSF